MKPYEITKDVIDLNKFVDHTLKTSYTQEELVIEDTTENACVNFTIEGTWWNSPENEQ